MQYLFYVTALGIINHLETWKIIVHYLCTYAEKRTQLERIEENQNFWKKIAEKIEIFSNNLEKTALNWGIALFSAVYN